MRRFISAAVLVASAGIYAFAAERATFIMTNGERKSGTLVFHGGQANNMIDNQLNLGDAGKEQSFPVDQVAVIDIAGGTPSATELGSLTSSGQAIAMRDGSGVVQGKFVNIVRGDTLLWQNEAGQQTQYAIRDIARIYLNPQAARSAFNYTGAPAAVGTAGSGTLEPGAVRVEANQAWTDSGITVKVGDLVAFRATGQITFGRSEGQSAGADGKSGALSPSYPVAAMPVGGLIGKVGNSAPFPIGSNTSPIRMPANGRLMLGINDNEVGDNGGFFSVVVTKSGSGR
jgi:hypothetical protein